MVFTMSHFYAGNWNESQMQYDTPRIDYYMCKPFSMPLESDVEWQRKFRHNNYRTTEMNK